MTLSELSRAFGPTRAAYAAGQLTFVGFVVGGPYEGCFVHVGTWLTVPRRRLWRRRQVSRDPFAGYFADFVGAAKHHDDTLEYSEWPLDFEQMEDFLRRHTILWAAPKDVDVFARAYLPHMQSRFWAGKPRMPDEPLPPNWPDKPAVTGFWKSP